MANAIRVDSAGGEYMESVVVLEWTAKLGDAVKAGDLLVTVETAKAATEIEVPCDGYLTAIFAETGSEVPLSAVLGLIGVTVEDMAFEAAVEPTSPTALTSTPAPISPAALPHSSAANTRLITSPAARRLADRQGIDLQSVRASSPSGRIKLRDLVQMPDLPAPALTTLPADDHGPLKIHRSGSKTGTPLLMIHGFGADAQSWFPIERDLSRRHPVIRIDLPNHGQSPKRRVGSFASLARDIAAAFDALHLESAHLLGHSLGGACALALADIRPRQIASLTLLAPGGLGAAINGDFIGGLARASRPESLGPWLRLMVANPKIIGDDFIAAAMALRSDPALRAAQQQMARDLFPDATQGFDLRAALSRQQCPTRILWGRADAILPWQHALEAPGRISLHLFEATGHVPQMERTEEVLAILRAQLSIEVNT
ncbi:acetoin dehydrogenase dihydrolipoyllysine-residue acetyltransferase subunit [Cypionkella sp.]|uniref:acetoin dehydrogenase dihydrolipoyllysine-residue acetyltransferase subunit n=1 Tax=Cypionkella sp. TaxID=2811411 RepID=UPI002ABC9232|nr:acetoin dehydrogenase dihydrolipoyllysine-residue acetyltransferase subunit [Cypionkella sp.]MDZ4394343.1 acetoin dehydrogenase dihydrolipoyllysine-residue acetyltransferase subunit [Cypionkella sp.]